MFVAYLNRPDYSYDVHSLVKAFYPEENVKVITPETKKSEKEELNEHIRLRVMFEDSVVSVEYFETFSETQTDSKIENVNPASKWKQDFCVTDFIKNDVKLFLYDCLCEITGKKLPWGNLTGIRPTKIVLGMLQEGKEETEIRDFMENKHKVSQEKIDLSFDIARREKEILSTLHYENGYSLYIGIPFCPTTCLYCSFTSYPICVHRDKVEKYIDCLMEEMKETAHIMKGRILDTVYIGGGTPTTLEADQLDRLIKALREIFDFKTVQEFTVEAGRADSITREKLEVLYGNGVSRISVNPQTMNEETLRFIGRKATAKETVKAYKMAKEIGFDNVNMDIILGLPGETEEDVANTINQIMELEPESLTVHSLAIKRASKLRQFIEENGVELLHNTDETMTIATKGAYEMGMHPYYLYRQKNMTGNLENVGFAKDGKYGIYNILIMEEVQTIVALGAGSITKRVFSDGRIERCDNVKDVGLYIDKIEEMLERKRKLFED